MWHFFISVWGWEGLGPGFFIFGLFALSLRPAKIILSYTLSANIKDLSQLTFLLFLSIEIFAQSPHPYFHNFTTADGLPSSEVHYVLEDDQGYMWFATDNGVSKFDGYSFKNFGPKEGLKHPVAFYLQKAPDGIIWIATLNGHLYFVKGDEIFPFGQNEVIEKYSQKGNTLFDFYIDPSTETKYISIIGSGVLAFYKNGAFQHLPKTNRRISLIRDDELMAGISTIVINRDLIKNDTAYPLPDSLEIIVDTIVSKEGAHKEKGIAANFGRLNFKQSEDLFFINNSFFRLKDNVIADLKQFDFYFFNKPIFEMEDGTLCIGFQSGGGLITLQSAEDLVSGSYNQFLAGKSVSHIFRDSDHSFWISTVEHGVFYISNFDQKIIDRSAGISTDYVSAIAIKNNNELYFGLRNGDLFYQNNTRNELTQMPKAPLKKKIINDLYYDKTQETLWATFDFPAYFKNGKWTEIGLVTFNSYFQAPLISKKISHRNNSIILWGTNADSFGAIDLIKKEKHFSSLNIGLKERIFSIRETLEGRIWIGSDRGLLEFRDNQLISPSPFHKAFEIRIEDMDELRDTTLVIATKGAGVLLWKENDLKQLTKADGLTSDMIENIHVDASGKIWAGTLAGLNVIIPMDTGYQIRKYNRWHGLPSNEITQVRSYGEQVWVATSKGLFKWIEPKQTSAIPAARIEKVFVNNHTHPMDNENIFAHDFNNFRFQFLTINYQMLGRIPYRFRLNEGPWNSTENRTASYTDLSSGKYIFEVQSQTEDGRWSKAAQYPFTIQPPWWATWWFRLSSILCLGGASFIWYSNRTKRFRKEKALLLEINQLERKALQAQMNPHFIFNSLNAIQNSILQKETDQAVAYLTKFATFTRWVLKSSADGKVLLEEEIHFLENYLSLEKLRFKNKFEFHFAIDDKLSLHDTYVLPLMIQPIVENAVKHGMKGKKENGKIDLIFTDANDSIYVQIRDNGEGIFTKENKSSIYQPMGMSITKRRLEVSGEEVPMKFTELKDTEGNIAGTEVGFFLKKI